MLSDRPWRRQLDPFPHVTADEVFVEEVAEEIAAATRKAVADSTLTHFGYYDATYSGLGEHPDWPLSIFSSREWLDLIAAAAGVTVTNHVAGGIHHHEINSASGAVHNDFNPVYFPDEAGVDDVVLPRGELVDYTSGEIRTPGTEPVEVVRAVSILYYTGNDAWKPGDGGQTGLYERRSDPITKPAVAMPPIDNSLMIFECSPHSYHGFLSNRRSERNSVVMWLHRRPDDATARWRDAPFELWH